MHFKTCQIPKASWIEHARITSSWRTIRSHPPYLPSPTHTTYSSLLYLQRSRHLNSTSSGASLWTSCASTLSATCLWKHKKSNQSSSSANGNHRLPCGDLAELSRTVIEECLFQTTLTNSTFIHCCQPSACGLKTLCHPWHRRIWQLRLDLDISLQLVLWASEQSALNISPSLSLWDTQPLSHGATPATEPLSNSVTQPLSHSSHSATQSLSHSVTQSLSYKGVITRSA